MFCCIFRLSYSRNKQTKVAYGQQLRKIIVSRSIYIWIWSEARDQESTNHSAHFVDWKSRYIIIVFVEHYHLKTRFDLMKGRDFIVGSNLVFEIPAHDQATLSYEVALKGESTACYECIRRVTWEATPESVHFEHLRRREPKFQTSQFSRISFFPHWEWNHSLIMRTYHKVS